LVLFSAPTGFSQGTPVFPSPQKPTFPSWNAQAHEQEPEPTTNSAWKIFPRFIFFHVRNNIKCITTDHSLARHRKLKFVSVCLKK